MYDQTSLLFTDKDAEKNIEAGRACCTLLRDCTVHVLAWGRQGACPAHAVPVGFFKTPFPNAAECGTPVHVRGLSGYGYHD